MENLKETVYLEDPGVDGRIILEWILEKWDRGQGTNWVDLAWHRNKQQAVENMVNNLWFPYNIGNFLTNLGQISCPRWILLSGITYYWKMF